MKNIEEVTIGFYDNGFVLSFSYRDDRDDYQTKRMVFMNIAEVHNYLDQLVAAHNKHGNTSI
jgi:hypothetical protein